MIFGGQLWTTHDFDRAGLVRAGTAIRVVPGVWGRGVTRAPPTRKQKARRTWALMEGGAGCGSEHATEAEGV